MIHVASWNEYKKKKKSAVEFVALLPRIQEESVSNFCVERSYPY
jgi:hypothetical protein